MGLTDSFLNSYSSADYLARQCIRDKEYCKAVLEELKEVIGQKDEKYTRLREMLKDYMKRVEEVNKQNREMSMQLKELQIQAMGISVRDGQRMKAEYEKGMSLRKLAEMFGCDKSTIKRRLIKMGVQIRK